MLIALTSSVEPPRSQAIAAGVDSVWVAHVVYLPRRRSYLCRDHLYLCCFPFAWKTAWFSRDRRHRCFDMAGLTTFVN